jgi:AdoMet-dependent rRNA methyltransferase SPB1
VPPEDLSILCQDIKVCGRRELQNLLKYRYKYTKMLEAEKRADKANAPKEEPKVLTEEELEAQIDKELEETIRRVEKDKKRAEKRERVKEKKNDIKKKMSVIASSSIHNEMDEVLFDRKTLERLRGVDIEEMGYEDLGDEEDNQLDEWKKRDQEEESEEDSDEEPETKRLKTMEKEITSYFDA